MFKKQYFLLLILSFNAFSSSKYLSSGFVRSATGRSSDAICEFLKDGVFYMELVYCKGALSAVEKDGCDCPQRQASTTPMLLSDFEMILEDQNTPYGTIDEIIENASEGKSVGYRDPLFLLAMSALEKNEKQLQAEKAKIAQEKAKIAQKAYEEKRKRMKEYTCTAFGTQVSRAYNNGIGRPIRSYTSNSTYVCTGCNEQAVRAEATRKFNDFSRAIYDSKSLQSLTCQESVTYSECTSTYISCRNKY